MRVDFDKMQGAGNDFILIDNRNGAVPSAEKKRLAVHFCRRCLGVGADGMIFVENDPEFDFAWDFYNADGSLAEMCGNGARCVSRYAQRIGAAGDSMTFRSLAGPIRAQLTDRGSKVQLTNVTLPKAADVVEVDGTSIPLWFMISGVPHAVAQVPDVEAVDVRGLGRALRHHAHFAPGGTNVNFFQIVGDGRLANRTYERGVEDETLACGTGSVAASIAAGAFLRQSSPLAVRTRSGEELMIHFTLSGGEAREIFLEGGAEMVFSGSFEM